MTHPALRHLARDEPVLITGTPRFHFLSTSIPGGAGGWPPALRPTRKITR
jgi:hypothetical protein